MAQISDNANVYDEAKIFDRARVYGDAALYGNAILRGDANVCGSAKIHGNTKVYKDATISAGQIFADVDVHDNISTLKEAEKYNGLDSLEDSINNLIANSSEETM